MHAPEGPRTIHIPFAETPPPTEFAVVGENKENPSQLLLLGEDDHYYAYSLPDGASSSIEPDADTWRIETSLQFNLFA